MTNRISIALCILTLGAGGLIPGAARGAEPPLNGVLQNLVAGAGLKDAVVGVSALDVKTGRVFCALGETELLIPASNLKLITTGAALLELGDAFEFTTALYAPAPDAQGVVQGDLVVVASGDPAISGREHDGRTTAVFDAWAAAIAKSVNRVTGDLVIDDTAFDRQYIHPAWPRDQLVRWYCAPVSAFALNDNCIDVSVKPGERAGDPAVVELDPPTAYFQIVNRCQTVASGADRAAINRLPESDTLVISGTLTPKGRGAGSPVAVVDPTAFAATVLRERLARAGVKIDGRTVAAASPVDTKDMARLAATSHRLADAVATANKRSQNFYAEMILKTLGARIKRPASFADGVSAVAKQLEAAGIKPGTYKMDDGSGLSKNNAFSAAQFAAFLRYMAASKQAETFLNSLAVAGADGTLKRRMDPACAGKVFAKTGHVRGVSALSGYVKSGDALIAFSILVNGDGLRSAAADRLQDSICRSLVEWSDQ